MYKMSAVFGLVLFSQVSMAGLECTSNEKNVLIIANHNSNLEAGGVLKLNGAKLKLSGSYSEENDYFYNVKAYKLMDQKGGKVDLTISTKTYMGRGGGCRTRVCEFDSNYQITSSKLQYNGTEIPVSCKTL